MSSPLLVGRHRETALLSGLLAGRGKRGDVLLVLGAPGIGMSTLLAAARRPATSRTPLAGAATATSASAAATSSAAIGCMGASGTWTVSVPGPAIAPRNSKNWVARRIV